MEDIILSTQLLGVPWWPGAVPGTGETAYCEGRLLPWRSPRPEDRQVPKQIAQETG